MSRERPSAHADSAAFRRACSRFATGVAIATVRAEDGTPHGLTVNSFASVSMEPPLILICIDLRCNFLQYFRRSSHFAVNVLAEAQRHLADAFAVKPKDRFDGVEWYEGETGSALLHGAIAALECGVQRIIAAGDHEILLGQVVSARVEEGQPLLYFRSDYREIA